MTVGFFYFGEFMDDPATIGNPVAMQKFYSDTNIFLFWSYGNSANIKGPEVTQLAIDAVKRMGGEIEMVPVQMFFPLGPTFVAIYGAFSAIIFSGYIIYDTYNLIKRFTYDDYTWIFFSHFHSFNTCNIFLLEKYQFSHWRENEREILALFSSY
ncbi:4-coumarate--CoA ligase [Forsythia ovata]|uniref:4-coumarate--CoA ligase n=1 Tax=Forsythia ovata TaxID=205694 RepID=A0ABD1NZL5_9LAMI